MSQSNPHTAEPLDRIKVLAVNSDNEELACFRAHFAGSIWTLDAVGTVAEATKWLAHNATPVVLCRSELPDGDWKDMLQFSRELDSFPNVVVTSRSADDRLWAEVLNLGGYDVLALPADPGDLFRSLSSAWRNWTHRCEDRQVRVFSPPGARLHTTLAAAGR